MAKLTARTRAAIPTAKFAGPNRSFPIQDASHARAALSMAHYASNPGSIKAAVHRAYPSIGTQHPHKNLGAYLHKAKGK
jgi:hypothetical protein